MSATPERTSAMPVMIGVTVGLAIGKPVGILLLSWICVRAGLCTLPRGITWSGVMIVGLTAGIGFTMSIFIAELAFAGQPGLLAVSKLAILIATTLAAVVGLIAGRALLREVDPEIAKMTPAQVEASTEF